jgi:predicted PolB exonuclease-like 3'-5' exonuclease
MLFRVLDIETVPDFRFLTPGEPKLAPKPMLEGAVGLFRFDELWYQAEIPFPPPQAHRVVAVAWCDVELNIGEPKRYSLVSTHRQAGWKDYNSEKQLVTAVREAMVTSPATLVTWNGRTFDLPVLSARALHLGVPWGWYYDDRNIRYRYSSDGHDDLMDFMSDFGAARQMKLGDIARLIGLPGKTDMDGSKVEGIVAQGHSMANEDKISGYCLQDAIQTALVFLRTRYHLEIVDAAGYAASVDTFAKDPHVRELLDVDWKKFREI